MRTQYLTIPCLLALALGAAPLTLADQSSITESEGYSCMGVDKSKKQTESAALQDAKRNAVEYSKTYIQSESLIENFELKKDLVQAFSRANVKVITILETTWQAPAEGDCYTIRIKAEVVPDPDEMRQVANTNQTIDDPTAPLNIKLWSNQPAYKDGEAMVIYMKGNKPFFGRLIYLDANDNSLQLLPNPFRTDNYFQGGVVYEVPQGNDHFDLTIQPPYGTEKLTLYASTSPLGAIDKSDAGSVYQVTEEQPQIAAKTRGINISAVKPGEKKKRVAEFDESSVTITTGE